MDTKTKATEVPFERLLEVVDRLDTKQRDLLHDRLIQREEQALVQQAEQAAQELNLANLTVPLNYWSVEKVLGELSSRLERYEQKFEIGSKVFYREAKRNPESIGPEAAAWINLYETYQRLKAAKRQVDIKAGRVVGPLPIGQIVSRQWTLSELQERLKQFEKLHGLSSAEFYESFKRGDQGDSAETFDWIHTYTAYLTMTGRDQPEAAEDV